MSSIAPWKQQYAPYTLIWAYLWRGRPIATTVTVVDSNLHDKDSIEAYLKYHVDRTRNVGIKRIGYISEAKRRKSWK